LAKHSIETNHSSNYPTLQCFDKLLNEAVMETLNDSLPAVKAAIESCKCFARKVQNSKSDQKMIKTAVQQINTDSIGDNPSKLF
jgi:hypothetical protein